MRNLFEALDRLGTRGVGRGQQNGAHRMGMRPALGRPGRSLVDRVDPLPAGAAPKRRRGGRVAQSTTSLMIMLWSDGRDESLTFITFSNRVAPEMPRTMITSSITP